MSARRGEPQVTQAGLFDNDSSKAATLPQEPRSVPNVSQSTTVEHRVVPNGETVQLAPAAASSWDASIALFFSRGR